MENRHRESIKEWITLQNKKDEKHYAWIKGLITIAAGLIAVLVSLKSGKSPTQFIHILFVGTIGLLSLGILSGAIFQFREVYYLKKSSEKHHRHILEMMEGKKEDLIAWIKYPLIYRISFFLSVLCFCLSLVCLTLYAYYIG